MARKKKKRGGRKQAGPGSAPAPEPSGPPLGKRLVMAGLAVMVVAVAVYFWQSNRDMMAFEKTAKLGKPLLSSVITEKYLGSGHYEFGRQAYFPGRFPTSGQHDLRWIEPGFHDAPQNKGKLVHALEHGNVVVYYDDPGAETIALLKSWSGLFGGQWSGLVVVPAPGLGQEVVLAAWRKKLRLKPFAEPAAAAFIDAFRGRGPEKPVR